MRAFFLRVSPAFSLPLRFSWRFFCPGTSLSRRFFCPGGSRFLAIPAWRFPTCPGGPWFGRTSTSTQSRFLVAFGAPAPSSKPIGVGLSKKAITIAMNEKRSRDDDHTHGCCMFYEVEKIGEWWASAKKIRAPLQRSGDVWDQARQPRVAIGPACWVMFRHSISLKQNNRWSSPSTNLPSSTSPPLSLNPPRIVETARRQGPKLSVGFDPYRIHSP